VSLIEESDCLRRPLAYLHLYPRFPEQLFESVVTVVAEGNEALYPGVRQHLGAKDTGRVGAVNGAALKADAMQGGLDDDILLGMNRPAYLLPLARGNPLLVPEATQLKAVLQAGGGTIVAGGQDMFVPDSDCPHVVPTTGGALRHHRGYLEKIVIDT